MFRALSYSSRSGRGSGGIRIAKQNRNLALSDEQKFFKEALRDANAVRTPEDSSRFFKACMAMDPLEVVFGLMDTSRQGQNVLRRAFTLGCGDKQALKTTVGFLETLGSDIITKGVAKVPAAKCYLTAYSTPGFLEAILDALKNKTIEDVSTVAWFLVTISRVDADARNNAIVSEITKIIHSQSNCSLTKQLAVLAIPGQIERASSSQPGSVSGLPLALPTDIKSLEELKALQPRHDNDFPMDYRRISIVPTPGELNADTSECGIPALEALRARSVDETDSDDASAKALIEAAMLDRQFRLLREDMIAPAKDELKEELKRPISDRRKIFLSPEIVGLELKPRPCILIRVQTTLALKGTYLLSSWQPVL